MMTETLANIHINKQHHHHHRKEKPNNNNNNNNNNIPKMSSTVNVLVHNVVKQENNVKRTGSFVFGQKLRESKWFNQSELRIFCAVVETGFIVEQKNGGEETSIRCGVAVWAPSYEKSKNGEYLTIATTVEVKGKIKVVQMKLNEFWPDDGTLIRINNSSDKSQTPLAEEEIRNQVEVADGFRKKWHNNEHFVYFCRYGPVESANLRIRKITDQLRWNAETLFLRIRNLKSK